MNYQKNPIESILKEDCTSYVYRRSDKIRLNKGRGPAKYRVDIPIIEVHGKSLQDAIDCVYEYIQEESDTIFQPVEE